MWGKLATKATLFLLRHASLKNEERQLLTAMLLEKLGALPLHARITLDNTGAVFVNGRKLDGETAISLRHAAAAMQRNAARKLVNEAIVFMAIVDGVHKNVTPDMGLFAKAALWFHQEEDKLYQALAALEPDYDE